MNAGSSDPDPGPRSQPPDTRDIAQFVAAREHVLGAISAACRRVGRDPAAVNLIAVSKTVPPDRLRAAVAAGLTVLGENRVQEGIDKIPEVPGAAWHLIGPLQANKVRRAVEAFAMIQTVDSVGLARRLERLSMELRPDEPMPVLLQVNVDVDAAKAGFDPGTVGAELGEILELPGLAVRGLMTVGKRVPDPAAARPTFVALRRLSEELRAAYPALGPELSMGMTDDYPVAVEEGATIVRIGRALFGARPALVTSAGSDRQDQKRDLG